jgi:hypothetical protein
MKPMKIKQLEKMTQQRCSSSSNAFFSPAKTKVRAKLFLFLCVGCTAVGCEGSVIGVGASPPLPERLKN